MMRKNQVCSNLLLLKEKYNMTEEECDYIDAAINHLMYGRLTNDKKVTQEDLKGKLDCRIEYINSLTGLDVETRQYIFKWFTEVSQRKVTLVQLQDRMKKLVEDCNGDLDLIKDTIKRAYLNNWFSWNVYNNYKSNTQNVVTTACNGPVKVIEGVEY